MGRKQVQGVVDRSLGEPGAGLTQLLEYLLSRQVTGLCQHELGDQQALGRGPDPVVV